MPIGVIGINHQQADTELRSQLAFSEADVITALHDLRNALGIEEAMIVSTCNRIEIYVRSELIGGILGWWSQYQQVCFKTLEPLVYQYRSTDAVRHAMRVAAGLDSMVMGEPQILGQFKLAMQQSEQAHMLGSKLNFVLQKVLNTAKQIRHETSIGYCPVSVAFSTTKLVQAQLGHLGDCRTLFIGAGDTITLMLKHLTQNGLQRPLIANRTLSKAQTLANTFGGTAFTLDHIEAHLDQADMVITATNAPEPLIDVTQLQGRQTPLLMIDMAVPHDIHPNVREHSAVTLMTIDDIQTVIRDNTLSRSQAAMEAHRIIEEQLERCQQDIRALDASHTITAIREQLLALSHQELNKALRKLRQGENPEDVLKQYAHALNQKWLHSPSTSLHKAGASGQTDMLEFAQFLFDLPTQQQ